MRLMDVFAAARAAVLVVCIVALQTRITWSAPATAPATAPEASGPEFRGRVAENPDDYPWLALLWITCDDGLISTCAGALIADNWVLTYAGCICSGKLSAVVDVGLHSSDIRDDLARGRHVERISVETVRTYPAKDKGIAIARLTKAVRNSSRVLRITSCSEEDATDVASGRLAVSAGWGATPSKSSIDPKPMYEVWMRMMTEESCGDSGMICAGENATLGNRTTLDSNEMSPSSASEQDLPCYAQKGSPLVLQEPNNSSSMHSWRLYGVLAYGMTCGDSPDTKIGSSGVFVAVCPYHQWIRATIKKEDGELKVRTYVYWCCCKYESHLFTLLLAVICNT